MKIFKYTLLLQKIMSNVTNSIPITLNDLLVKLQILSMIERGQKINMGTMTFVDSSSWFGSIQRSLNGEGRKSLMIQINQIIHQAIEAISEYKNTEFYKLIIDKLDSSKLGLDNLSITYQNDPNIVAQVKVCIDNINLQIRRHQN